MTAESTPTLRSGIAFNLAESSSAAYSGRRLVVKSSFFGLIAFASLGIAFGASIAADVARFGVASFQGASLIVVDGIIFALAGLFGLVWGSSLPGARTLRVSELGIEISYGPNRTESFNWRNGGPGFQIFDYTTVRRMGGAVVSDYEMRGAHFWQRSTPLLQEHVEAIFDSAKSNGAFVKTYVPSIVAGLPIGTIIHEFKVSRGGCVP
jgi:hypothetical protein